MKSMDRNAFVLMLKTVREGLVIDITSRDWDHYAAERAVMVEKITKFLKDEFNADN